ncbi:hypothetical protein SDRG_06978 [Saprolegnia diclina VS20]|uniref:Uncharacterized protein n=1 Tax=Saprolegnia diclina (strain VS20) TaxID=1156394 RepID=T0RT87_SAPDV|nr:hypothetical protein SDRG_06978 [Saprolegnia diclina VS20]EQC35698.1 hypothetical protein SDRG_06978 [Saprolegnia diclina VS20]|eukprot:XP_008611015.1 hypothetical protein SDRG_06978 [Saprolegnia diclina VS20]
MACSWTGLLAIFLSVAALTLATIALAIPMWSSTVIPGDIKNATAYQNVKFTTGVWGYCVNADFGSSGIVLDQCFSFYRTAGAGGELKMNGSSVTKIAIGLDVCSEYLNTNSSTAMISTRIAGMDKDAFYGFMDKSCGSLGKVTLAFATLGMAFGLLSVLSLVLFVTCCAATSRFVTFASIFTLATFGSTLIAFCCWAGQVQPLGGYVSYGAGFGLEIASFVLALAAFVAIKLHQSYGEKALIKEPNIKV